MLMMIQNIISTIIYVDDDNNYIFRTIIYVDDDTKYNIYYNIC